MANKKRKHNHINIHQKNIHHKKLQKFKQKDAHPIKKKKKNKSNFF